MAKNKIQDLRNHLFETLEALKDPDKPMDLERARVISGVAQTIINSAKVEVELVRQVGDCVPGSAFFDLPEERDLLPKIARVNERRADFMTIPTTEEIRIAHEAVKAEGPLSRNQIMLAAQVLLNPILRDAIDALVLRFDTREVPLAAAFGAGLNYGLRINELRKAAGQ